MFSKGRVVLWEEVWLPIDGGGIIVCPVPPPNVPKVMSAQKAFDHLALILDSGKHCPLIEEIVISQDGRRNELVVWVSEPLGDNPERGRAFIYKSDIDNLLYIVLNYVEDKGVCSSTVAEKLPGLTAYMASAKIGAPVG